MIENINFFFFNLEVHGNLTTLTSCICPGYEAIFECVVTGGTTTTWSGTAFDRCSSDEIILHHSQFNQFGHSFNETCGDSGPIIGRAVSVVNDSYTSQLIVNVSQSLIGENIECASDSGSHGGTKQILLTTGMVQFNSQHTCLSQFKFYFSTSLTSKQCHAISDHDQ